jgi:subtilisin family serine protease
MSFRPSRMSVLVRVAVAVAVAAALLVATAPASGTTAPQLYLLLAKGNSLPQGLAAKVEAAGGTLTTGIPEIGVAYASSSSDAFQLNATKIAGLQSVSHSFRTQWVSPVQTVSGPGVDVASPPNTNDDDFLFDFQWGHDAVDAPEAWAAGARGDGARVAVIDTGFDLTHPDLAPNVNLALSRNFVPGETLQYVPPPNPADVFSHGTHTAGTVAAADNAFGTIGVAPDAELVLVKGLPDAGCGTDAPVLEGIVYAAGPADADIINMSFGDRLERDGFVHPGCDGVPGTADDIPLTAQEVAASAKALSRAANYARGQGATLIASAGNDGEDKDHSGNAIHIPSDTPGVVSIAATGPHGWGLDPTTDLDLPGTILGLPGASGIYTNFGQSAIDFAAPGGSVDFGIPGNCTTLAVPCWVLDLVLSTDFQGWTWALGTSMAAPHASGVAAIIVGENGGSMNPAHVEQELRTSADDLGKTGNDDFYGAGRVNAGNAAG